VIPEAPAKEESEAKEETKKEAEKADNSTEEAK